MNQKIICDLHMHSTSSDGTYHPAALVYKAEKFAEENNCHCIIALTDHDNTSGLDEFMDAGSESELVTTIPGTELSISYKGEDVHITSLKFDYNDPGINEMMEKCRNSRLDRNVEIVKKLNELGFPINLSDIKADKPGATVARPHIARHMMKLGYVSSIQEAFDLYLDDGKPAFVERWHPSPQEAIHAVRRCGGIPILAHINLYDSLTNEEKEEMVKEFKEAGLMGIECYYNSFTEEDRAFTQYLAKKYDLVPCGGSDFHGDNKPNLKMFTGKGDLSIEAHEIKELLDLLGIQLRDNSKPLSFSRTHTLSGESKCPEKY